MHYFKIFGGFLPAVALHEQQNFAAAMVGLGSGFRFSR
jgi:hypothetical protein